MLESLVESGRIVDLILGFVVLEVVLVGWLRRPGFGAIEAAINALAGAGLLLALRAALAGSGWRAVAGWLAVALAAHLADVLRRILAAPTRSRPAPR